MIFKYWRRLRGREKTTLDNERLRREKKELEHLTVKLNRATRDYKQEVQKVLDKNRSHRDATENLIRSVAILDKALKNTKKDKSKAIQARDKEWTETIRKETKELKKQVKILKAEVKEEQELRFSQQDEHEAKLKKLWTEKMKSYEIPYEYREEFKNDGRERLAQSLLDISALKNLYAYADLRTTLESHGFELQESWDGALELKYTGEAYEPAITTIVTELCQAYQKLIDKATGLQQTILNLETTTTKDIEIARLRNSMSQMEIKIDALHAQRNLTDDEDVPID